MFVRIGSLIRPEILLRMVADATMVFLSIVGAVALGSLGSLGAESLYEKSTSQNLLNLLPNVILILMVSLAVFYLSGFYTRNRVYRGRYKALALIQGVTLAYVIVGFIGYLSPHIMGLGRETLFASYLLTLLMMLCARLWWFAWSYFVGPHGVQPAVNLKSKDSPLVLVIGGAGYIGSALIPKLLMEGYRVRLMDIFLYGEEPIKPYVGHPSVEIMRADFRQVDQVVKAMQGAESVIHLGGIVGDPACALDEQFTLEVNLVATRLIAEVAKGNGISRFVFASTCSVYGASDQVLDEKSTLNPVSLYAKSKIGCEKVLNLLTDEDFRPVILRFGTIYGLSGRTRFDLVVNLLAAKAKFDGRVTVFGAEQWRPFIHVEDAANSILLTLQAPEPVVGGQVFNVGSDDQNMTLGELGALVHKLVPSSDLICTPLDAKDLRNYRVNCRKIQQRLGFRPKWTVEAGIKQVLDAISDGKILDYRDARYSNVRYLEQSGNLEQLRVPQAVNHGLVELELLKETRDIPEQTMPA